MRTPTITPIIVILLTTHVCAQTAEEYLQQAHEYKQHKDITSAITCCKKALELEPNNTSALTHLGNLYYISEPYSSTKRPLDKALACFEKVVPLQPTSANALYNLADTCKEYGDAHRALQLYKKIISVATSYIQDSNDGNGCQRN